ncbi:MAG: ribonuclease E/G [Candidatus Heimdallarchaeaceae archaeon]
MVSPTFRIRSIYDLSLIKLITEHLGYKLVQPTDEQSRVFDVEQNHAPYDIEIVDILGGYGISIEADDEYVRSITSLLQEKLPNALILQHPVQLHAVYNGKVVHVNPQKKLCIVDIGEDVNAILFGSKFHRGQRVIVQINQLNVFEDQLPVCSTIIHFPGQTVILERDASFVRVSRKLSSTDRDRLFTLGKQLRPDNHGLIMRTSAVEFTPAEIQSDIDQLVKQSEELDLLISGSSYGPGILLPGHTVSHIILVKDAKDTLTSIRNQITPTIPSYHWFMSYSPELQLTTMYAERLIPYVEKDKLSSLLRTLILESEFANNKLITILEHRLTAPPLVRVAGQITWDNDILVVNRTFRSSKGVHFGLNIDIHEGDSSKLITKEGSWSLHTKIYRDDKLLGETVKIVTPIELCNGGKLRYIDLGLLIVKHGDNVELINSGLLSDLIEKKMIAEALKEQILSLVDNAMHQLKEGKERIILYVPTSS